MADMPPWGADRLEDLRSRLEAIAEELADLGQATLVEALETGSPAPEAQERRLSRARREVLKAAAMLGDRPDDES